MGSGGTMGTMGTKEPCIRCDPHHPGEAAIFWGRGSISRPIVNHYYYTYLTATFPGQPE